MVKAVYVLKPYVYFVTIYEILKKTAYCFINFHESQQSKQSVLKMTLIQDLFVL